MSKEYSLPLDKSLKVLHISMTDLVGHGMLPMTLGGPGWDDEMVLSPPLPLEDATKVVGSDTGHDATSVFDVSIESDPLSLPVSKP